MAKIIHCESGMICKSFERVADKCPYILSCPGGKIMNHFNFLMHFFFVLESNYPCTKQCSYLTQIGPIMCEMWNCTMPTSPKENFHLGLFDLDLMTSHIILVILCFIVLGFIALFVFKNYFFRETKDYSKA